MVVLCLCHSSVDNIIGELTFKAQTRLLISIYLENYTEKLNPEVIMNANYSRFLSNVARNVEMVA